MHVRKKFKSFTLWTLMPTRFYHTGLSVASCRIVESSQFMGAQWAYQHWVGHCTGLVLGWTLGLTDGRLELRGCLLAGWSLGLEVGPWSCLLSSWIVGRVFALFQHTEQTCKSYCGGNKLSHTLLVSLSECWSRHRLRPATCSWQLWCGRDDKYHNADVNCQFQQPPFPHFQCRFRRKVFIEEYETTNHHQPPTTNHQRETYRKL